MLRKKPNYSHCDMSGQTLLRNNIRQNNTSAPQQSLMTAVSRNSVKRYQATPVCRSIAVIFHQELTDSLTRQFTANF